MAYLLIARAWWRASAALMAFLFGGMTLHQVETVTPTPEWVRQVTLLRMLVFRERSGASWAYRHKFSRWLHHLHKVVPRAVVYRLIVLPVCAWELITLTRRSVAKFGDSKRTRSGLSRSYQFADVLATCFRTPGVIPVEYYVYGLDRSAGHLAREITNPCEVEIVATLVRPPRSMDYAAGFVSGELGALNDKEQFRQLCRLADTPVADWIAVFKAGTVQWNRGPDLPRHDLFLKPLGGGEGRGAARVFHDAAADTYRIEPPVAPLTATSYATGQLSGPELVRWLEERGGELPLLLEPRLVAHRDLRELVGETTLPTLRVVTVADAAGAASLLYAYLRFATADVAVDNGLAGGLVAMLDLDRCSLTTVGSAYGDEVQVHPMTGQPLHGFVMPFAQTAFDYCLRLHRVVATTQHVPVPVLGWDVAILDSGPVLIEGNPLSGTSRAQKLVGEGSWAVEDFRRKVLSYLVPLAGQRIELDPGRELER